MTQTFHKTVDIKTVDDEARTATGAVLVPDELDHQQDFLRPDAVERFHAEDPETGVMHSAFPDDAADLERNEVISEAEEIGDETFPAGTWVATRRYEDDDLWQLVEDGILTGFSIGGEISRAAEHDELPDDVRVPDSVDHEGGGTELLAGQVNEVSDVDIPAVPRASYKGAEMGKAILDDVDGEAEFVELMTEQRGHDESDARELYQYLTSVRDKTRRKDVLDSVGKPFESPQGAEFEDFEDCVNTLLADGELDRAEAEAVCGAWQDESKNKVEVNGTEVDLTPPAAVVNAAEAALEAKRERFAEEIGDCGSGVGEDRAEAIIANNLQPEDFVGGENTAIPDYLDSHSEDVNGIDQPPTDWDAETWTDGCGPVQYALWGGTATGTGLEWANNTEQELLDAIDKNLDNPEFARGDAVEWSSNDATVRGRVADVGEQFSPAEGVTITGDDGEAVYLIHELDDSLEPPQYRRENVAKPQSSLDESAADLPPLEGNFADEASNMTDTDSIDDATKLQVIKSWLTGSDDSDAAEAPDAAKASDGGDEMEDDEDDEDDMDNGKSADMSNGNPSDPPEWAKSLTDTVEQISDRVDKLEGDDGDSAEKTMDDVPEWAQDLTEKVNDLDERVDAISKQSGHSQQLDATEKDADDDLDEVDKFKADLVGR